MVFAHSSLTHGSRLRPSSTSASRQLFDQRQRLVYWRVIHCSARGLIIVENILRSPASLTYSECEFPTIRQRCLKNKTRHIQSFILNVHLIWHREALVFQLSLRLTYLLTYLLRWQRDPKCGLSWLRHFSRSCAALAIYWLEDHRVRLLRCRFTDSGVLADRSKYLFLKFRSPLIFFKWYTQRSLCALASPMLLGWATTFPVTA